MILSFKYKKFLNIKKQEFELAIKMSYKHAKHTTKSTINLIYNFTSICFKYHSKH